MKCLSTLLFCFFISNSYSQGSFQTLPGAIDFIFDRVDDTFWLDAERGFACDGGGRIIKTADGGNTFEQTYFNPSQYLRAIEFLDENVGLCGTLDNTLLRSSDAGETWTEVDLPFSAPGICGLHAIDDERVYAVGSFFGPAFYMFSEDSGLTWINVDMSDHAEGLVDVYFINEEVGFMVGIGDTGGVMLKTTDAGQTWTNTFTTPTVGDYLWKVQQLIGDDEFIYASIESFTTSNNLIISTDQGETWTLKTSPYLDMQGIGFQTPLHGWIGGHQSNLLETWDGGDSWTDTGTNWNANRMFFLEDGSIFLSGQAISKYQELTSLPETAQRPEGPEFTLSPNPSTTELLIDIKAIRPDNLILRIYDNKGSMVMSYPAYRVNPGNSQIRLNHDLNAGTYILVTHTNLGQSGHTFIVE
jgi:photosystem II stability/assembly factor-like uncharacterized protein